MLALSSMAIFTDLVRQGKESAPLVVSTVPGGYTYK